MKEKAKELFFQIGITCAGCALDMENILLDNDGILEVSASYAKGTLVVGYDPAEIDEEEVIELVAKLGLTITNTSSTP
jgi:copper chaperone CopZ